MHIRMQRGERVDQRPSVGIGAAVSGGGAKAVPTYTARRGGFVVESGEAPAKMDGVERRLGPGNELDVPINQPHANAFKAATADLVLRHWFEPTSEFALSYVEPVGHMM
jgi:hypothetical protein